MKQDTEKKLKICITVSVILCVALCITSFALAILASSYVRDNRFTTGTVDVSVSEKNSIYVASGFEPGMSLDRTYVVHNNSPVDVWYKVCLHFFDEIDLFFTETVLTVKLLIDVANRLRPVDIGSVGDILKRNNLPNHRRTMLCYLFHSE